MDENPYQSPQEPCAVASEEPADPEQLNLGGYLGAVGGTVVGFWLTLGLSWPRNEGALIGSGAVGGMVVGAILGNKLWKRATNP